MKRGLTMFPFLLIFVMIVGAVILIFFFQFGTDLSFTSKNVNKLTVLKSIDQQLAALALPNNVVEDIELGIKSEIQTTCKNSQTELTFEDKTLKSQKLIVSPITIEGKSIQAWTLSWDYPFKVDNLYYLIPGIGEPKNINIFIKEPSSSNNEQRKFISDFKLHFTKISSLSEVSSTSDHKIIFILENINPVPQPRTTIIKIPLNEQDWNLMNIRICRDFTCEDKKYLGNPLAIALAFSNSEDYECIEQQALNKLSNIITIHEKKVELLNSKSNCDYTGILEYLSNLRDIAQGSVSDLNTPAGLDSANRRLRLDSCPQLYSQ